MKWCDTRQEKEIKNIITGIDCILRSSYISHTPDNNFGCLRWMCSCRHDLGCHLYVSCHRCLCIKFEYLDNNHCDTDCAIQRKIWEATNVV